jgi:hypothetical protein
MNINTYIDILILIGVFSNAYVNVKKYIKDNKHVPAHQKPCLTLTYNNGYVDVSKLAKANPHLHIHTDYQHTLFD